MMNLYETLGGTDTLSAAVDLFYEKVLADEAISGFFESVDMDEQREKQRLFLACAFGGPVVYSRNDMRTAHAHLDLTEDHYQAVAGHLEATLRELGVARELIAEVMMIAARTHDDVLNLRKAA
ncbi:MAG: group I truncated hemoglobin [Planctomycetota bacterium]|jgi:hemoglobin